MGLDALFKLLKFPNEKENQRLTEKYPLKLNSVVSFIE